MLLTCWARLPVTWVLAITAPAGGMPPAGTTLRRYSPRPAASVTVDSSPWRAFLSAAAVVLERAGEAEVAEPSSEDEPTRASRESYTSMRERPYSRRRESRRRAA